MWSEIAYDANGNTTSSAGISNTYDFENRMTQHGTGPGLLLAYDGDGNRVAETIGGATTKYLVDDRNPCGIMRFHQRAQLAPRHHLLHLLQKYRSPRLP